MLLERAAWLFSYFRDMVTSTEILPGSVVKVFKIVGTDVRLPAVGVVVKCEPKQDYEWYLVKLVWTEYTLKHVCQECKHTTYSIERRTREVSVRRDWLTTDLNEQLDMAELRSQPISLPELPKLSRYTTVG